MGDKVGVDPADHAGVHISDLKDVMDLRVTGTTAAVDHLAHSPIPIVPFPGLEVVPGDHCHPWDNSQKDRLFILPVLWRLVDPVINRHRQRASLFVLAIMGLAVQARASTRSAAAINSDSLALVP